MLRVHSVRRGKVVVDHPSSARLAAKAATSRAVGGARVTVFDGNKVVMICDPAEKGLLRIARCRISPAFKKRIKRGLG